MSGDWNMTSTWVGGVIPGAGQDVIISTGHVVTLSDARTCDDITINSGGTLSLNSGGNFTPTGIFTTIGILNLAGAVVPATQAFVVNGTCTISQPYSFQNPGGFSGTGTVVISSGLTLTGNYSFPNVNQTSGIISGTSMVTINGNYTFAAGNMNITGNLSVLGTMNCSGGTFGFFFSTPEKITVAGLTTISNNTSFNFDTIVLNGGMNWTEGSIELNNAAKMIIPAGQQLLYTIANNRSIGTGGGVIGTLQMNGTFVKQGTFQVDVACHLTHTGSMDIQGGTIQMREGGGTLSGSINIGAGSTFKFINGGSYTLTGPVTGTGLFSVHGVSLTITGNQTFHNLTQLSGSISGATDITVLNNFNFNAGLFNTIGSLTVNGALNWAGGTFGAFANPSDTIFVAGLTTISGSVTVHRFILLLNGGCSWMDGNIELNNLSKMVLPSGQQLICTIPSQRSVFAGTNDGSFQNDGTFIKQGSQIVIMSVSFAHNGSLDIQNGTFRFQGGTSNLIGSINLAASGQLQFTGGNYSLTGPVTGTGTLSLGGATLTVIGDHTFPNFTHNNASGTLNGTGNITVTGNYNFSQGLINNIGNLTIGGTLTWDGGLIGLNGSSTGNVTVAGLATITGAIGSLNIRGKTLLLNGGANWTGGVINFQNNGKMVIGSGQNYTVNIPSTAQFSSGDNTGAIDNFGILLKNNSSTTLQTSTAFTNKASGTIKGLGTLTYPGLPFINQGTIAPGLSPGILTMDKFSTAGTIEIEIAGTAGAGMPGGHDQLNLTTLPIALGGNLNILLTNGFAPVPGNAFIIMTLPSGYTGTFATVSPCWNIAYNATNVTVTYTPASFTSCPSNINLNNTPGLCSKVVTYSIDTTGIPTPSFSFIFSGATNTTGSGIGSGSAFNVGLTTVNIIANNGCSGDTCSFTVTINDVDVPSINCPPNVTVNTAPGICTASGVALGTPTTTDNCGVASTTNNALSTYPIGNTNVTWTVTDVHGLVSTCIQTVTVVDNQDPVITCPANITQSANPGTCSKTISYSATATDNCGISGIGYVPASGSSFNVGTTLVTATATDVNGRTSTCIFNVTITDDENPVITCPANINQNTNPGACIATVTFSATATDNCAIASIVYSPASGSSFPIGTTLVTATATDVNGRSSSCTFNVTVTDNQPPQLTCPTNITANTDAGICTASSVVLGTPTATDNCGIASTTNNALSIYPIGVTNVTWTVTDVHGLVSTCIQTVTVVDNQDPVITCPANISMNADPGTCTKVVTYSASATDNCGVSGIGYSPASGSTFSVGTTIVTATATDVNGRTSICTFTVTILDPEDPVITCPANINQNNSPGQCSANVTFNAVATDNCGTPTITYVPNSGSSFPVGTTMVTATATDAGGRTSSCTFTVTITDNQPPSLTCPPNLTVNAGAGLCSATGVSLGSPITSDNCGIASTTNNGLTTYPVGTTQVTWTSTDVHGLISTCNQSVTVVDNQNPVITCPSNITMPADPNTCSKNVSYTASASDNCGISTVVYNPASGSSFNVGTSLVTVTATDIHGHTSTCTFSVTITESVPPTISCPADMYINISSGCSTIVNYTVSFSDNCAGAVLTQTSGLPSGSSFPAGSTTNSFVATDASGNTSVCQFIVYVIPPGEIPNNGIDDDCDGMIDELPQKAGINTTQPTAMLHVELGDVLFTGPTTLPITPANPPASGAVTRMMWYPDKAATRTGYVTGTEWDKDSIGTYSFAAGYGTKAIGTFSTAIGYQARANGIASIGLCIYPYSIGDSSIAIGTTLNVPGSKSIVIGNFLNVTSSKSIGMGYYNSSSSDSSIVFGNNSFTQGINSLACGSNAYTTGHKAMAFGISSANGEQAFSFRGNAFGNYSVSLGGTAFGEGSVSLDGAAYGKYSSSIGESSLTRGFSSFATGMYSDSMVTTQTNVTPTTPLFVVGNGISGTNGSSHAMVVRKDGKVGIGNIVPGYHLHVVSTNAGSGGWTDGIVVENFAPAVSAGEAALAFRNAALPIGKIWVKGINQLNPGITFSYGTSLASSYSKMILDTLGHLGVGTYTPTFNLQVSNNNNGAGGYAQGVLIQNTSSSADPGEAAISFRNNRLEGGKYLIMGLDQSTKLSFNYGTSFESAGEKMMIDTIGRVGIETSSPAFLLEVNGTAGKPGGGNWSATSDIRLKNQIQPYKEGWTSLQQIAPIRFKYNELSGYNEEAEYVGVIAQDLKNIAPYMVDEQKDSPFLRVDPSAMTYMLINTVHEQQQQIEKLKTKIALIKSLLLQKQQAK